MRRLLVNRTYSSGGSSLLPVCRNIVTDETVHDSLIKPALIASLFLGSETSPPTAETGMSLTSGFWNALSGYLFARMARREGMPLSYPIVTPNHLSRDT